MGVPEIDIGMTAKQRETISKGLSKVLADSFFLYLKTHNYHWNVKGPMFHSLHIMFMDQYTELWNALDEIAERIRSLGFHAPATFREFSRLSSITEQEGEVAAQDMIRDLVMGSQNVTRICREVLDVANKADDQPTVDLLTNRMQVHEKNAWMLRSLLETGEVPVVASKAKKK